MRLICGLMRLDGGAAQLSLLRRLVAQMDVSRLRPGRTEFCEGAVALAALDFSAAAPGPLPVLGKVVMAADVRLDEPDELARDLGVRGPAEGALLATLGRLGTPGLGRVLGDFAFAAWDGEAQTLTCGRDVFGVRPFYYAYKPGELFAFASAPSALHGAGIVPKTIDAAALVRRATNAWSFDHSLIEGIARLPPGHALVVSSHGLALRRYWGLERAKVGSARISPADAARELRRLVEQAVRSRLPKSGEVGAHLSGGLDSSAIAILAARALGDEGRCLHAYSFLDRPRNDLRLEDETAFVEACREAESGIDWRPVWQSAREFEEGYAFDPDLMHPLDRDDPEMQVAATAEGQGVKLILSGWGGDEAATFNGRGALAELAKRGRWGTLRREIEALAKERRWSAREVFVREVFNPLVGRFLPDGLKRLRRRALGRRPPRADLVRGALTAEARGMLKDAPPDPVWADGRQSRWELINHPHIAHRAEVWALVGARHGLAYTFPLLDRRVVEFALSLPSEFFVSGGFRRRPFRDAMQDVLPEEVRLRHQKYRPFPGRSLDLVDAREALLARIAALADDARVRRLFDVEQLRELAERLPAADQLRREMADHDDAEADDALIAVSRLLDLASYLQQHGEVMRAPAGAPVPRQRDVLPSPWPQAD
jgi:asparagine synthase (glutamine-hydrolysing)